jgi:hypothetical protein
MIEVIGDRRNTGFCLMCGTDLMIPWNDYQCCGECTKRIVSCRKKVESREGKVNKVRRDIVHKLKIAKQRKTIGGIPQE